MGWKNFKSKFQLNIDSNKTETKKINQRVKVILVAIGAALIIVLLVYLFYWSHTITK